MDIIYILYTYIYILYTYIYILYDISINYITNNAKLGVSEKGVNLLPKWQFFRRNMMMNRRIESGTQFSDALW